MDIVILAAGKGERLWPLTRNTPKCLLEVGEGHTLLEAQLLAIAKAPEVNRVLVVTGYRSSQIEAKIKTFEQRVPIEVLYNPFFEVSNNIASLWLGLYRVTGDMVVVNGDDLFHPQVLSGLLAETKKNEIVMTVSRKDGYDEDDMKIVDEDNLLQRVGKDIPLPDATGESIGMICFRGVGVDKIRRVSDQIVRRQDGIQQFWLRSVQGVVDEGWSVKTFEVHQEDWREMDFHPDREEIKRHLESKKGLETWWLENR